MMLPFRHRYLNYAVMVVAMLLLTAVVVVAQDGEFSGAIGGVRSLYKSLALLLRIVIGLGAMVVLTMIVLNIMRGEREAAGKLVWWLVGLVFGFIMLFILEGIAEKV